MKRFLFRDETIATVIFIVTAYLFVEFDFFEMLHEFTRRYEEVWELDEIIALTVPFSVITAWYALRRYREAQKSRDELVGFYKSDTLTGLPNRIVFEEQLQSRPGSQVVIVNVIDFSSVNKAIGFSEADKLLVKIAQRLKTLVRETIDEELYRLYSNEFVFFCDEDEVKTQHVCETIKRAFEQKLIKSGGLQMQVGINLSFSHIEPKLFTALMAMEESKRSSHRPIVGYDLSLNHSESAHRNIAMLHTIKQAIDEERIYPVFQAIYDNTTGEAVSYEALARIKERDGGVIMPGQFIELSKKFKLYPFITKAMIEKSFEAFQANGMDFSLNFSFIDIDSDETVAFLCEKLEAYPDVAARMTVEILETEDITDYAVLEAFHKKIKTFGCKLAIDDFGSGYSNWVQIFKLHPDYIKIDASLIQGLDVDPQNVNLVKTILSFTSRNNIRTIAEFVSTEKLALIVKELGIDMSQGYFYAKPEEDPGFLTTEP